MRNMCGTFLHEDECIARFSYLLWPLPSEVAHLYLNVKSFDKVAKDWSNEFPKSIFWAGVEEFLFKWIIFLLNNRKNEKN